MRLYLDANPIIYTVEANPEFQAGVLSWVRQAEEASGLLMTSRLSLIECRSHPMHRGDQGALASFDRFFGGNNLLLFDVSGDVIDLATYVMAYKTTSHPTSVKGDKNVVTATMSLARASSPPISTAIG